MNQDQAQFQEQADRQGTLDPHCMACNMPLKTDEDRGTNADGTKNDEYCCHCLINGEKK